MDRDRRSSRRTGVRLPFRWCRVSDGDSLTDLARSWELEAQLEHQQRMAHIDAEIDAQLRGVRDAATAGALRLLASKISLLDDCLPGVAQVPDQTTIDLGTDGVGFDTDSPLASGDRLGVQIVLPGGYHLLCHASVTNRHKQDSAYHIGARLTDLPTPAANRLTRFIIR